MFSTTNRLILFAATIFLCLILIAGSIAGLLAPAEGLATVPIGAFQQVVRGVTRNVTDFLNNLSTLRDQRSRIAELERALVNANNELVDLRERAADYDRLASVVRYLQSNPTQRGLAATVVSFDTTGILRTIRIDKGSRDGVRIGLPVVTDLGLVGRIYQVGATSSLVQIINDTNSFINVRMQTTRTLGTINGTSSGGLVVKFVQLTDEIKEGDSVITSGIGGNFPRGILVGQVTNQRVDDTQLFKEAQVRSLVDFNRLELVLVLTEFERIDIDSLNAPTAVPGVPVGP